MTFLGLLEYWELAYELDIHNPNGFDVYRDCLDGYLI